MNPQTTLSPKEEFNKKYWFNSLQMVEVINPLPEDWPFMVEMRHFVVRAGQHENFPGVIANVYLDQMSKILAQNDDNLGFMADPAMKSIYYDKLIVNLESLVNEVDTTPAYLKNVSPTAIGSAPEKAPWESTQGERASDVATQAPIAPPAAPIAPQPLEDPNKTPKKTESKEFELDGAKYKMVVDKNDKEMYYKNGRMTSGAEYSRAASML